MRNIKEVIDQMLGVIPIDKDRLRVILKRHKESASLAPPEGQYLWWQETQLVLNEEIDITKQPFNEWQQKVFDIWTDK